MFNLDKPCLICIILLLPEKRYAGGKHVPWVFSEMRSGLKTEGENKL